MLIPRRIIILIGRLNKIFKDFASKTNALFCLNIFVFEFFILLTVILSVNYFFVKYKNSLTSIIFIFSKQLFIIIQKY